MVGHIKRRFEYNYKKDKTLQKLRTSITPDGAIGSPRSTYSDLDETPYMTDVRDLSNLPPGASPDMVIESDDIWTAILASTVAIPRHSIYMADRWYIGYDYGTITEKVESVLKSLSLAYKLEFFDCDDFAMVVSGEMHKTLIGVPFGVIWVRGDRNDFTSRKVDHALNCFYAHEPSNQDNHGLWLLEPQWKPSWGSIAEGLYRFSDPEYRWCKTHFVLI